MSLSMSWCTSCTLTTLGALLALRIVFGVFSYVWLHFLRPKTNLAKYVCLPV
jgi:hypothetical protein